LNKFKNKAISLLLIILLLFPAGCSKIKDEITGSYTTADASAYLTEFFSDYSEMCAYLKDDSIAISAFALDGAGLSAVLRALYQAQKLTFAFSEPREVSSGVFQADVTVLAPDMVELFELYNIDREISEISGEAQGEDYVAEAFYANLVDNMQPLTETTVEVTCRVSFGNWSVDPNDALAFAIFPNVQNVQLAQ